MKKIFVLFTLLAACAWTAQAEGKIIFAVSGNQLLPADTGFTDVYGSSVMLPEFSLGYKVYKDFYVFAGYGFFSKTGKTPELQADAKTKQGILSIGAGINRSLGKKFEYFASLGLASFDYEEDALDDIVSGSTIGVRLDGAVVYRIGSKVFAGMTIGYLYATDTIEDLSVKLGGFKFGLLLGVKI